jgi:hypothetical protein
MPDLQLISPGLRFRNTFGGVRIKLSDAEVKSLTGTAERAAPSAARLSTAALQHYKVIEKPVHGSITSEAIQIALKVVISELRRKNDDYGNRGVVIEIGYPNIMPEVFAPSHWDYKYAPGSLARNRDLIVVPVKLSDGSRVSMRIEANNALIDQDGYIREFTYRESEGTVVHLKLHPKTKNSSTIDDSGYFAVDNGELVIVHPIRTE